MVNPKSQEHSEYISCLLIRITSIIAKRWKGSRKPPDKNVAAIPVDYGTQINKPMLETDAGYMCAPNLVYTIYTDISRGKGISCFSDVDGEKIRFRVNCT